MSFAKLTVIILGHNQDHKILKRFLGILGIRKTFWASEHSDDDDSEDVMLPTYRTRAENSTYVSFPINVFVEFYS